jgi:predicted GIY-YIG superfamily endonuclease
MKNSDVVKKYQELMNIRLVSEYFNVHQRVISKILKSENINTSNPIIKYPKNNDFLFEISSKYETKKDFRINDPKHYKVSYRRNLLDEMFPNDNPKSLRDIYGFIFKESTSIYIGLTCNIKRRYKEHLSKECSPVYNYINKTNEKYEFKVLTDLPLNSKDASEREIELIKEYYYNGWNILNKNGGGGLGGHYFIWDLEIIYTEALKYTTKVDFRKNNPNAYHAAVRLKIVDDVCKHMIKLYPNWTDEQLYFEAKKYKTRGEFQINSIKAYNASRRRGILEDVCSHMTSIYTSWSKDKLFSEAKKYNTRSEFIKKCPGGYESATSKGILNEICVHMKQMKISWDLNSMMDIANRYDSIKTLRRDYEFVYRKLLKLGVIKNLY